MTEVRTQPIGFNIQSGKLRLVLTESTFLEFDPDEMGLAKLVRHLQGLQTLPQGFTPPELAHPAHKGTEPVIVYTFPTAAYGSGISSSQARKLSREQLHEATKDLFD